MGDRLSSKIETLSNEVDNNTGKDAALRQEVELLVGKNEASSEYIATSIAENRTDIDGLLRNVQALKKACDTNFNFKAVTAMPFRRAEPTPENASGDGGRQEVEEPPKIDNFLQLLKYLYTKPFEKIEQQETKSKMGVIKAKKKLRDEMKERNDHLLAKLDEHKAKSRDRRAQLEANLMKMDEKYRGKLRSLEETLINEELMPAPADDDSFYDEPSLFEPLPEEMESMEPSAPDEPGSPGRERNSEMGASQSDGLEGCDEVGQDLASARRGGAVSALEPGHAERAASGTEAHSGIGPGEFLGGGAEDRGVGAGPANASASGAQVGAATSRLSRVPRQQPRSQLSAKKHFSAARRADKAPTSKMSKSDADKNASFKQSVGRAGAASSGGGSGKLGQLTDLVNLIQNEMKTQNLKVAQQIEKINGDIQTIEDKRKRLLEELGLDAASEDETQLQSTPTQLTKGKPTKGAASQSPGKKPTLGAFGKSTASQKFTDP